MSYGEMRSQNDLKVWKVEGWKFQDYYIFLLIRCIFDWNFGTIECHRIFFFYILEYPFKNSATYSVYFQIAMTFGPP